MKEDKRFYQAHIVTDPRILAGKPVIKGTRIGVDLVLEELAPSLRAGCFSACGAGSSFCPMLR